MFKNGGARDGSWGPQPLPVHRGAPHCDDGSAGVRVNYRVTLVVQLVAPSVSVTMGMTIVSVGAAVATLMANPTTGAAAARVAAPQRLALCQKQQDGRMERRKFNGIRDRTCGSCEKEPGQVKLGGRNDAIPRHSSGPYKSGGRGL